MTTLPQTKARIEAACKSRGLTRAHGYKLIKNGQLPVYKVGRASLVDLAELDALIEAQRVTDAKAMPDAEAMRRLRALRKRRLAAPAKQLVASGGE